MSDKFFVRYRNRETGPHSLDELKQAYRSEAFRQAASLRMEEGGNWFPVSKLANQLQQNEAPDPMVSSDAFEELSPKKTRQPAVLPAAGKNATSFGTAIIIYARIGRILGVMMMFVACIVALASFERSGPVAAVAAIAIGVVSLFWLLVLSQLFEAVVYLVRNSFRTCELLEASILIGEKQS